MIILGLVAGYFTLFAAGIGVALLIMRGSPRLNLVECACLAWLFGVGFVSLLLWLGGIFASGIALQGLVIASCLVLGILGWRVKQRNQIEFSLPKPSNSIEWVLAVLLLVELVAIFLVSLKHTLGWDGLFNWEIKARYAFLGSGVLPESYYSSAGRAFSHPEYPLAIPFTELWLYLWMGAPHQFLIKTMFPLFYIAGALLLALFVTRLSGKRWLGLLAALLVPFVPFVTASPGGVIVGYTDIPLSVFYLTALGYLLCTLESNSPYAMIAYASILTIIPWIKSEGLILWSILAATGLIVGLRQHRLRAFVIATLPGLLLIIGWRAYLKAMHTVMPSDFARPTLQLLGENLTRLGAIVGTAFAEITETSHWSIFWLLVLVAVIYLLMARRLSRLLLAIAVVGPVILYTMTYFFSAWPSYTAHMTSSLPRLLLHVMPAGWLAIGLALQLSASKTQTGKLESKIG
jgi:hypothetical protein